MMAQDTLKVLEINAANQLSTGTIMLGIAETARREGITVYTASKYNRQSAELEKIRKNPFHFLIGSRWENTLNRYISWYTDYQDVGSWLGTKHLIKRIESLNPDVIHLHDIVGWYIQLDILFSFLKAYGKPVLWTMHDCWAYTGRCIHYGMIGCEQWKDGCKKCPQCSMYPSSKLFDRCEWNYVRKKRLFSDLPKLTIVTPSCWLAEEVRHSFFKNRPISVIHNGIDLEVFHPRPSKFREYNDLKEKKVILAAASAWNERKGLRDLYLLAERLPKDFQLVLAGLSKKQMAELPDSILGVIRTGNAEQMAEIYSAADVFVNPTKEEVLGMVNLEAQACGIPVVTYRTGGSPECVCPDTGVVVEKGDINAMAGAVVCLCRSGHADFREKCIRHASAFDKNIKFMKYVNLYREMAEEIR